MLTLNLPNLPWNVPGAMLLRWLRQPGAEVVRGEPLLVVLTDRAEVLLPVTAGGTLGALHAAEGQQVAPGAPLAAIIPHAAGHVPQQVAATPLAAALADAYKIDFSTVVGSLPAFQSPQVLTSKYVNLGAVADHRAAQQAVFARKGFMPSDLAYVALAALAALPQHPLVNAYWSGDGIVLRQRVHLAVLETAADRPPRVILDAGDLNLAGLARAFAELPATEDHAATFTIADLGSAMPAIPQRQAAILGLWAHRPQAQLTLAHDSRVLDQQQADAFLLAVRDAIEIT